MKIITANKQNLLCRQHSLFRFSISFSYIAPIPMLNTYHITSHPMIIYKKRGQFFFFFFLAGRKNAEGPRKAASAVGGRGGLVTL